jgi:DNA-binding NtrC family response regulator
MPALTLTPKAIERLMAYRWPGNVRQLKNIAEKLTVLSPERELDAETIGPYMPQENTDGSLLVLNNEGSSESFNNEREILYKILFGLREDVRYIKSTVNELLRRSVRMESADYMHNVKYQLERRPANDYYDTLDEPENYQTSFVEDDFEELSANKDKHSFEDLTSTTEPENDEDTEMENLSIVANERQLIVRVLNKCGGRRKDAAKILGISERTLIRKMSDYNLK